MSLNARYSFLSHVYFYFGENANLRVRVEITIFSAEIKAYFAVKFRHQNQFASARNLLKALLWYLDIRFKCVFFKFESRLAPEIISTSRRLVLLD